MKASVCIATYDKPHHLGRTLESIFRQNQTGDFEVIVVDDGSPSEEVRGVCAAYPAVRYHRIERPPGYRNPAAARNAAYLAASGDVVICQSDDVQHASPNTINTMVDLLSPGHFVIATVVNVDEKGRQYADPEGDGYGDKLKVYTSPRMRRPLFFLGALYRKDLYAIGGNDEDFVDPGYEDDWFADCLQHGLGLSAIFTDKVLGRHLHHSHTTDYPGIRRSQKMYEKKRSRAANNETPWCASGGQWSIR